MHNSVSRIKSGLSGKPRGEVEAFHAMDLLARAFELKQAGKPVISLAVGQPASKAPERVRRAAADAVMSADLGYTNALGRTDLREAISRHYKEHYGVDVPARRIAVTTGSSAGFSLAFLAMTEPGDRVAITSPGYPAYRNILHALNLDCVEIETDQGTLDPADLERAHKEKPIALLLLASPANPTGAVIPQDRLEEIVATCRRLGIRYISDEIYHRLNFVAPDFTAASLGDDIIVINSFSKYYCMTGWRIGWMVLPETMVRTIERLAQNIYICAPDLSQIAAIEAFNASDELEPVRATYQQNRELLLQRLPELGFTFAAPPDGAFYAWVDCSAHTNDSMAFAKKMLEEVFVAGAPGADFDPFNAPRRMRFSYAGSHAQMVEAMDRLQNWLK